MYISSCRHLSAGVCAQNTRVHPCTPLPHAPPFNRFCIQTHRVLPREAPHSPRHFYFPFPLLSYNQEWILFTLFVWLHWPGRTQTTITVGVSHDEAATSPSTSAPMTPDFLPNPASFRAKVPTKLARLPRYVPRKRERDSWRIECDQGASVNSQSSIQTPLEILTGILQAHSPRCLKP